MRCRLCGLAIHTFSMPLVLDFAFFEVQLMTVIGLRACQRAQNLHVTLYGPAINVVMLLSSESN